MSNHIDNNENPQGFSSVEDLRRQLEEAENEAKVEVPLETEVVAVEETATEAVEEVLTSLNTADSATNETTPQVSVVAEGATAPVPNSNHLVPAKEFEMKTLEASIRDTEEEFKKEDRFEEVVGLLTQALQDIVKDTRTNSEASVEMSKKISNISIDLSSITIDQNATSNPLIVQEQLSILEKAYPVHSFPVICLKSGYRAEMTALTTNDKINIHNLRGSEMDQLTAMLKLIHSHIRSTSLGRRPSYEEFVRITAEDDYDTLLYGIYYATYPESIEYNITCPHCKTENSVKLAPDHLFEVIDRERSGQYVTKVLNGYGKGEEFLSESLVNTPKRIMLPKSSFVIELHTPTLHHLLHNLGQMDTPAKRNNGLMVFMKLIKTFLIPNYQELLRGNAVFYPVNDKNLILQHLNTLSSEDIRELNKAVVDLNMQYRLDYRIPDINCASSTCGKEIKKISIDITQLLFFAIHGELNQV